jgi:hypothetical protein
MTQASFPDEPAVFGNEKTNGSSHLNKIAAIQLDEFVIASTIAGQRLAELIETRRERVSRRANGQYR